MLKALGLGKHGSPSDDQIREHKEQQEIHNFWKSDVDRLSRIIRELGESYNEHKSSLMWTRYEELKKMTKKTISDFHKAMEAHQAGPSKPSHTSSDNSPAEAKSAKRGQTLPSNGRTGGGGGAIGRLLSNAKGFAEKQQEVSTVTKNYTTMTSVQVKEDTEQMRSQIVRLKEEFRKKKEKLEALENSYEDSKEFDPARRYPLLKSNIKTVTREL